MPSTRRPALLLALPLLFASAGCAGGATAARLRSKAAVDIRCPEDQIKIEPAQEQARYVEGCGRRVLYMRQCDAAAHCDWVMRDARPD